MKKSIIAAVAAGIMTLAGMAAVKTVSHKTSLFERNVEALSEGEIIVGPLCMKVPNRACGSLGVVYSDHYPA